MFQESEKIKHTLYIIIENTLVLAMISMSKCI